jgi:VWFA-related protein
MSIRTLAAGAAIAFVLAASSRPSAQNPSPSPPTFRSRVDVISVDVVVTDKQGRPVEDLKPGDFTVKVDGRNRPVVSAQLVKVDPSPKPSAAADTFVSSNAGSVSGRRIVVAVDQTLIAPGAIAPLMRSAARFVDALGPADYAAVFAFPEPGLRVDFTVDKSLVREAMPRIVGQPAKIRTTTFTLSMQEAENIERSERTSLNILGGSADEIWSSMGPTIRRVVERGCRSLTVEELKTLEHLEDLKRCLRDLVLDASSEVADRRAEAELSLRRLGSLLRELALLDGPKAMVLVSAGLVADDAALAEVTKLAADARTTIHVVSVDREGERDRTDLPNRQSELKLQDRALELHGLETIADGTGGTLYRAIVPAVGVFDRLASALSASYVIGVERRDGDPERQRIEVDVRRRGVTLRSPRVVTTGAQTNGGRSLEEALGQALASPLPQPGIPLRLSTFIRREASSEAYMVNLAAQIGATGSPAGELAVGYAVLDQENRLVTSRTQRVPMTGSPDASVLLPYETATTLRPGTYSIRFAVVDPAGHRGVVVRRVELPEPVATTLTTSDLIIGATTGGAPTLIPAVEPHVDARLAAYLELYAPDGQRGTVSVVLEIAEGEASPALIRAPLNIGAGAQPDWRVASGTVGAALLPGRYVARASVQLDGVPVRVVARPFVLDRAGPRQLTAAPAGATAAPLGPIPLAPDARVRTASYVSAFVRALSNVVGQEDFEVAGHKVRSEFLLVQHPASPGDFLTYRDIVQVNGVDVPDRQERLADLFLEPGSPARDRVRQITQAAEQYVPSLLNPIFVVAFLQAGMQARFELTERDAGGHWPPAVKAVSFVETARPTILRAGLQGERDVPVRGTAWIEPETGRVLQTELHVPSGRSTTSIVTTFALDQRLQIMVPAQMRTQNPNGVATYSNFRRFSVRTETAVDTDHLP